MAYTVHLGPREAEYPVEIGRFATRAEAQALAKRELATAHAARVFPTSAKVEVRQDGVRLLDAYTIRGSSVRSIYSFNQRGASATADDEAFAEDAQAARDDAEHAGQFRQPL